MSKLSNINEFIIKAIKVHGTDYDYTNSIYINSRTDINIYIVINIKLNLI